jgi:hypothetical protein
MSDVSHTVAEFTRYFEPSQRTAELQVGPLPLGWRLWLGFGSPKRPNWRLWLKFGRPSAHIGAYGWGLGRPSAHIDAYGWGLGDRHTGYPSETPSGLNILGAGRLNLVVGSKAWQNPWTWQNSPFGERKGKLSKCKQNA